MKRSGVIVLSFILALTLLFSLASMPLVSAYWLSNFFGKITGHVVSGPTNGLVAYYPLDGNTNDASGNGNNGINNGATQVSGKINGAYSFNGSNYINLGTNLEAKNIKTVSFWVNFNSLSAPQEIFSKSVSHCGLELILYGGFLGMYVMDEGGYCANVTVSGESAITYSTSMLSTGTWYHLAAVQNGTFMAIYLNGTQVANGSFMNTIGNAGVSSDIIPLMLGAWTEPSSYPYGGQRFFRGSLDELRIYDRVLTDSEIKQLAGVEGNVSACVPFCTLLFKNYVPLQREFGIESFPFMFGFDLQVAVI